MVAPLTLTLKIPFTITNMIPSQSFRIRNNVSANNHLTQTQLVRRRQRQRQQGRRQRRRERRQEERERQQQETQPS